MNTLAKHERLIAAYYRLSDFVGELHYRTGDDQPTFHTMSSCIDKINALLSMLHATHIQMRLLRGGAYHDFMNVIYPHSKPSWWRE